ncbi:MAG: CCA tRNA nucleotidyltransferase [Leptolyngbya sp. SIO4C1]|nr:CCA tRNA nucleotidyltransferase [Leptolyngbya sp. SIO4C1]
MASALSPKTWPFAIDLLPETAYLVGGSVRDALLHRQADYLDLDFVLPEGAIALASTIAKRYKVGFVVLDTENQIARAVFERATIDFAQQVGPTLETDLRRRDFTINAIAYHPQTNALIDPLAGIQDLEHQTLRMVSAENLADDPLRLLRAYRQAAQLQFAIAPSTRAAIRQLAARLDRVAAERVRHEIDALLSQPSGTSYLRLAWEDGVLSFWLPQLGDAQLQQLMAIDRAVERLKPRADYAQQLQTWKSPVPAGHYRSWIKAAKLTQILPAEPDLAEAQLARLKYSRSETQAVLKVIQAQPYLEQLAASHLSRCEAHFFFKSVGSSLPAVALAAIAQGVPQARVEALFDRYLIGDDPIAHPRPLLTGRDLMQHLQLKPGPQIGELLSEIELAQAEGRLNSAAAALDWVKTQRH